MAVDKLINQTQGDEIITALSDISEKLEDVTTMTPAKLGFGYTVCDTAADTAAKTANLANYQITEGSVVFVKFTNGNTATNPTLNLNNTGAKPMYYRGAAVESDVIVAGDIGTFVYSTNVYNLVSTDAGGVRRSTVSGG